MKLTLLTRNFGLKAFSFGVALVMFIFVSLESTTPQDVEFPIEYRVANGMVVTGNPPDVLRATLQGPWANLRTWKTEDLQPVVIDLTNKVADTHRVEIETEWIKPPAGMDVKAFRPAEVTVGVDRLLSSNFPVVVTYDKLPPLGFRISGEQVEPRTVTVSGPASMVIGIDDDDIETRPLDLSGSQDDVDIEREVRFREPKPGLRLMPRRVRLHIEIEEEFVERTFDGIEVELLNGAPGMVAKPNEVTVTLKGPRRIVDKLQDDDVEIAVDALPEVGEGQTRFEKAVVLRNGSDNTLLVAPVPQVTIEVPRKRRRRR